MEKMPLITVITAVYCPVSAGRTDVFREMMASVAELGKYCSVEHWIQDGGSQDGSMDLYQEYRGQIHLESAPDGGIYDAMNKASFAASGKYLMTPQGIFPFGFFFSSGVPDSGVAGDSHAVQAVVARMKELIRGEDPRNPLSDEALAEALNAENIAIARRTVAKYREAAGIPKRSLRRKHS